MKQLSKISDLEVLVFAVRYVVIVNISPETNSSNDLLLIGRAEFRT